MTKVRRVFLAGCKTLAVNILHTMMDCPEFEVQGVLTKDHWDDMAIWHSIGEESLDDVAEKQYGLPVYRRDNINDMEPELTAMNLDYIFLSSWSQLVNSKIMELPKIGCFNFHIAHLPKNRGCFPIQWAMINDDEIAATIHKVSTGPDNGHIVAQRRVSYYPHENAKTVWKRAMDYSSHLFEDIHEQFTKLTFTLTPQDERHATHHSRFLPFGGQVNPYWQEYKKQRFIRAMDFPPFENLKDDVPAVMKDFDKPSVRIALGFDVDAPRGSWVSSKEGSELAWNVLNQLVIMSQVFEANQIPRTYFICGDFLETMHNWLDSFESEMSDLAEPLKSYGVEMEDLFWKKYPNLVEIADHTYYHSAIKAIPTRPDRPPINSFHVMKEWEKNSVLFQEFFGIPPEVPRGFRAPYGYYQGLQGRPKFIDRFQTDGVLYVSSDLRDKYHNSYGALIGEDGMPRQPYRYENGLLEIPSHGWQDTAFRGGKTPVTNIPFPPRETDQIVEYYKSLIWIAKYQADQFQRDIFISLTLHPHAIMNYDPRLRTIECMQAELEEIGGSFVTHLDIYNHYGGF